MKNKNISYLNRLFRPRAIAVIGASDDVARGASMFLHALKENGFPKLYPVNPHFEEVMGLTCYPNVQDIPEEIDLAIIGIPGQLVPTALEDCIAKGVKFAHIFTAGFKETGAEAGIELENRLIDISKGSLRLIGPNCMGVHCPNSRIRWDKNHKTFSGKVAFISQSGGHAGHFIEMAVDRGLGICKLISLGNSCDLGVSDFLEYFLTDPESEIIGLYLEGFQKNEGRHFFDIIKSAKPHKPIVLWKAGKTPHGARAASSHTAALAGSYDTFLSAARQLGLLLVSSIDEMVDVILSLETSSPPRGPGVGILGIGGGQSVGITDGLSLLGLEVPELEEETQKKIAEIIRDPGTIIKNPVDPGMACIIDPRKIGQILLIMAEDKNIDALYYHQFVDLLVEWNDRGRNIDAERIKRELCDVLNDIKGKIPKPIICAFNSRSGRLEIYKEWLSMRDAFRRKGIGVYPSLEKASRVLYSLYRYSQSPNELNS
ncbi:acetate--CoA ligase family protein [Thermodesulfobacteriota bacterium]